MRKVEANPVPVSGVTKREGISVLPLKHAPRQFLMLTLVTGETSPGITNRNEWRHLRDPALVGVRLAPGSGRTA